MRADTRIGPMGLAAELHPNRDKLSRESRTENQNSDFTTEFTESTEEP
jgi:hypothetical protein